MYAVTVWEYFSHQGATASLSPKHYKSVILTNQISVTAALFSVLLAVLYYALSLTLLFISEYLTFVILMSCVWLNHLGRQRWAFYQMAKAVLFLVINVNIFFTSSTLGYESGFHLLYYAALLGMMLFYNLHKRLIFLVAGLVVSLTCIVLLESTNYSLFAVRTLSPKVLHLIYFTSLITSLSLSLLFAFYFNRITVRQQESMAVAQHQLEAIFENSYDAIALVDPRTNLIHACNHKATGLFGVDDTSAPLIGSNVEQFQKHILSQTEKRHILRALHRQGRWVHGPELVTARGEPFWGDVGVTLLKVRGKTLLLIRIADVTAAKVAETNLRKSESALREAQRLARIGSFEFDLPARKGEVSEEFYRIFGVGLGEEFAFDRLMALMLPGYDMALREMLEQSSAESNTFKFECRARQAVSGSPVHLQLLGKIVSFENGKPARMVGTIQDITDRKLREIELIKAKNMAEQASVAKEQFLSTMSHEVRTPINAILGMSHYLLHDNPQPQQIENLEVLQFSAENLLLLVNDILDLNKLEAGKIEFEEIGFDFRHTIRRITQTHLYSAAEKGLLFTCDIDGNIPFTVLGDPVRLAQVLNNLLSNAMKFTETGWVKMEMELNSQTENSLEINFSVEDSGIGIAKDKLDLVFESFTQASSDTTRKYGGTGLGLTITKRLLELQNSIIYVKSELGGGSGFYFTLRFKKPAVHQIPATISAKTFSGHPLKGVRLLVVEDNEINRLVTAKFLDRWEIVYDYAVDGEKALDKVAANAYDLVLMDLQLPGIDGFETTRRIRGHSPVPVLAMTASPLSEVKDRIFGAGMDDYILKPFQPDDLLRKITKYATCSITEKPAAQPAFVAPVTDTSAFRPMLNYGKILELTADNDNYRQLLTQSYIKLLGQLKTDYENALLAGDLSQLRFIINYIEPPFTFLEVTGTREEIMFGIKLIEKPVSDINILNRSIERIHNYCNQLSRELEGRLLEKSA